MYSIVDLEATGGKFNEESIIFLVGIFIKLVGKFCSIICFVLLLL